jgi:hypothetical protein
VLGEHLPRTRELRVNWSATTLFLNRGDRFEARALPLAAQVAPVFGITVADFDGDGAEDVFLAQNFFATEPEAPRHDAGRGLLLRGNGRGELTPVSAAESGIAIHGEQRGAAAADYDGDGRTDLAVTQNAAPTRLFRNTAAPPGLRVRLTGPPGNEAGIGAVLRVGTGAARELHAGAGWWSQDSATTVLHAGAGELIVRWPGGAVTTNAVTAGARQLTVKGR